MARKYRPQKFADVVGQEHVARTLQNAIAANRVAQAYLFCGAHGCGKTTMARLFSRALVCEKGVSANPCGECEICKSVMRGGDADVIEIDGASNNGVEQVRELRDQAAYAPTRARDKIYIIDEVHMLSVGAFNALLKTLEEPPPHVKFILATTDPQKLPTTILSRCQRFDFRLVPAAQLTGFFQTLVAKERAEITADALAAVAAFSGGSVRDGLVLLDQLLSFGNGKVTREDVEQVRGVASAETVAGLYLAVVEKNLPQALAFIDAVAQRGTNAGEFLDQLIEFGRDLLQISATKKFDAVNAYGPAKEALRKIGGALSLEQILLMLDVFGEARTRVKQRALSNPQVPLEMAVARLAGVDNLTSMPELLAELAGKADFAASAAGASGTGANAAGQSKTNDAPAQHREAATVAQKPAEKSAPASPPTAHRPLPAETTPIAKTEATPPPPAPASLPTAHCPLPTDSAEIWEKIKAAVARQHPADAVYLKDVDCEKMDGDALSLRCSPLTLEQCEDDARRARLAAIAQTVAGRTLNLNFLPRGAAPKKRAPVADEIAALPEVALVLKNFRGTICEVVNER